MLKVVLEGLAPGLKSFPTAALDAAFPLAAAFRTWLAEPPWAPYTETYGTAVALAVVLVAGSAWIQRFLFARARPALLDLLHPAPTGPAASPAAARSLGAANGAPPDPVVPGARPLREAGVERAGSELVLDALRSRMDEVRYTPGSPNVLSMTKYLSRGGGERAASAGRPGGEAEASASLDGSGGRTTLRIDGVLDAVTVARVRPTIEALVAERRPSITVDLSLLRLIDSSGVGLIVGLFKRCRTYGGVVQVSGLKDQPLAIFRMLRLERIFMPS